MIFVYIQTCAIYSGFIHAELFVEQIPFDWESFCAHSRWIHRRSGVWRIAPRGRSDCRVGVDATVNDGLCHRSGESQALLYCQDNGFPIMALRSLP